MANEEEMYEEAPELPELLESVLIFAINEARNNLLENGEFAPFTAVALSADDVMVAEQSGEDADELYAAAQKSVEETEDALAYAFCYDGYVDTDEGNLDAIIAEGGIPGDPAGYAVCCLYHVEGDELSVDEEIVFIGDSPNFLEDCCLDGEEKEF